mgnify:CR=1 FL=1
MVRRVRDVGEDGHRGRWIVSGGVMLAARANGLVRGGGAQRRTGDVAGAAGVVLAVKQQAMSVAQDTGRVIASESKYNLHVRVLRYDEVVDRGWRLASARRVQMEAQQRRDWRTRWWG